MQTKDKYIVPPDKYIVPTDKYIAPWKDTRYLLLSSFFL
jgi:hypothetical protein